MTLKPAVSPHLRRTERAAGMSLDVLVALIPLTVFSCVYYGFRPVQLLLTGILSAVACELFACVLMGRRPTPLDGTAAVTGGIIGALMSPLSPLWLPAVAAAFAIWIVKMPFGGKGRNIFNPAAGGIAFVTLLFPEKLFCYPDPEQAFSGLETAATVTSPAAQLQSGGETMYHFSNLLLGDFPGPVGAVAILILSACALYLLSRRTVSLWIVAPYLVVCAVCALAFPRVTGGWQNSLMLELCSGYLLFAGVFMVTDPVTAPRHWLARLLYGAAAGALVMVLRYTGQYEEGCCFAVLLVNLFSTLLDRGCWGLCYTARVWWQSRKGGAAA